MDLASDPNITGVSAINNNQINGVVLDSGSLSGDESWNNPDIVYWMSGSVTVLQGDTLTVAPGQIVKAACGGNNLIVNGTLNGRKGRRRTPSCSHPSGTTPMAATPTTTALVRAATGTGAAFSSAAPARTTCWDSWTFFSAAVGATTPPSSTTAGALTLDNGVVGNSYTAGLRIAGANPTLVGDTFQNNSGPAVSMDLTSDRNITASRAINNQINGVALDSGSLSGNESWNNPDIVYWMSGNVTVPQGDTLTVTPDRLSARPTGART